MTFILELLRDLSAAGALTGDPLLAGRPPVGAPILSGTVRRRGVVWCGGLIFQCARRWVLAAGGFDSSVRQ
jgi:hypothetical protein